MSGSLTVSGNKYIGFSGDSWDGSFLPPQLATGSKVALVGETGLQNSTPLLTVEVGSTTADLLPATGTFTLSIKVATGTIGQTLSIYRSNYNGGDVWTVNSPDSTCMLDNNKMCTFRADHLSLYTMGAPNFDCGAATGSTQSDCQSLVDLYTATDGDHWTHT